MTSIDSIDELRTYVQVLDSGSLTAAARAMGLTKNAISRRLARLEQRTGARLVERDTRRLAATDDGVAFYHDCVAILRTVDAAQERLGRRVQGARGTVRLAVPEYFARIMTRHVHTFFADNPAVSLQLVVDDHPVSLVGEALDVAVVVGPVADTTLVARRLGVVPTVMAASTEYLQRRGRPKEPDDLRTHDCLCFVGEVLQTHWCLVDLAGGRRDAPVSGRLSSTSSEALRAALLAGHGIDFLHPDELQGRADIERVLPAFEIVPFEGFALYSSKQRRSPKIRRVLDMLERILPSKRP